MPAYLSGPPNMVVLDSVVRRSPAASVYSQVLERELFRTLRQEGGYSYTASCSYDVRDGEHAMITAFADALGDKQDAVLGGFVDVLAKLKVGRIEQADLAAIWSKNEQGGKHPEAEAGRLPGHAIDLLTGQPVESLEAMLEELRAVTVADVHEVAVEVMGTLLQTPHGHGAAWAGFTAAPTQSTETVFGARHESINDSAPVLIIGAEGVSQTGEWGATTVRYDACEIMLTWPDGARQLVGSDGMIVRIEPSLYRLPAETLAGLDQRVPAAVKVNRPARGPQDIPPPNTARPSSAPSELSPGRAAVLILAMIALFGLGFWLFSGR